MERQEKAILGVCMTQRRISPLTLAGAASVIALVVVIAGCATLPAADAGGLWQHIAVDSSYTEWAAWPGMDGFLDSGAPHGNEVKIFVNDVAAGSSTESMKNGAMVIKENYTPDRELAAVTVMYKVDGYNPEAGDWFWAKYQPDGSVDAAGKVEGCIQCHGGAVHNDYLMRLGQ